MKHVFGVSGDTIWNLIRNIYKYTRSFLEILLLLEAHTKKLHGEDKVVVMYNLKVWTPNGEIIIKKVVHILVGSTVQEVLLSE